MTEITLTWGDHNNLCVMFEKLFEESVLVDCTLAAEGKYVKAHKTILSAFSPFLQLLFTQESEKNPIVILTHIKFQELKAMIDLIYRGKVKVSEEYLDDFLRAAESLQIKGLERDYIKDKKRNGTAMSIAQELPNHVSHISLSQHQVNKVSGNEYCGTATSSLGADMDIARLSSQMNHLNSCRINQNSTSVNVADDSIPSRFAHRESELKSISSANSLFLETDTKCEPTSEEVVPKMEFVQCEEECVEENAPHYFSPSEATCKESTSSSRLATASDLLTDSLGSCEPNQCSSSVRVLDNSDQNSVDPVSIQHLQGEGEQLLSVSTFPSTSYIDERQEKNTDDLMPRIEFTESSKEIVTEGSAFDSGSYTSETAGAAAEDVDVEVKEVFVEAEGAPSLACVECGEVFGDASQLSEHAHTHTGERPFACETCGKAFSALGALKTHFRTHTGERPFPCFVCGKAFPRSDTLKKHLRTHTGERPYTCEVCGDTFRQLSTLLPHKRRHTGELKLLPCDLCGRAFSDSRTLEQHKRTHTGERPFACEMCGKAFSTLATLKTHSRTHTGERPFACETCGKAFSTLATLKTHSRTHTGERPFACEMCGKAFSTLATLKTHSRTHTGERPFVCEVCGKAFTDQGSLKSHFRIHTGERPFPCHLCSKAFPRSDTLKNHLRTHTGERPYPCHLCGKAFRKSFILKQHLRTHTGERPFACHLCGKAFGLSTTLTTHLRLHTGERPFACHVCGKAFSQSHGLTTHLRTHTGEHPYPCLTCGKAFKTSSALRYHLRTQHSGQCPGPAPRVSSSGPS